MKKTFHYLSIITLFILIFITSCQEKKEAYRAEINAGIKAFYDLKPEASRKHFKNAIKMDATKAEPYLYLSRMALDEGQITPSLEYINKALELNPKYGEAYRTKAQINTIQGKKDEACQNYKNAKKYGVHNLDNKLKFCK